MIESENGSYRGRKIFVWKYSYGVQYGRMSMEKEDEPPPLKISPKL